MVENINGEDASSLISYTASSVFSCVRLSAFFPTWYYKLDISGQYHQYTIYPIEIKQFGGIDLEAISLVLESRAGLACILANTI